MHQLWQESVESHRQSVQQAILIAVGGVVAEQGLLAVTMSQIATRAGIGRATLYKHFPDVEALVVAWHEQHVAEHLHTLATLRDGPGNLSSRLAAVLDGYAQICQQRHRHIGNDLATLLHRDADPQQRQLHDLIAGLISEATTAGEVRSDIPAAVLASYCLHALEAAADLTTAAQRRDLVGLVQASLSTGAEVTP